MLRVVGVVVLLAGCEKILDLADVKPVHDDGGTAGDGQTAGGSDDAAVDSGPTCVGHYGGTPAGLFQTCLDPTIPATFTVPVAIDTGSAGKPAGDCTSVIPQTDANHTEVCLIAARTMTFDVTTTVTGSRPLVLATSGDLTIAGTLIVASTRGHTPGPGHDFAGCATAINGQGNTTGASAGAGGSFQLIGGAGGSGSTFAATAAVAEPAISFVRGGCKGGNGGATGSGTPGAGGSGGGAVYLVAGGTLTISGTVEASGAGGGAGVTGNANAGCGAGGGGSGGLIGLDARSIVIKGTAKLVANGGGGGAGATNVASGTAGGDPSSAGAFPYTAPAGIAPSGAGGGGAGGTASAVAVKGTNAPTSGTGGGGGGGGVGWIELYTPMPTVETGAKITPAPQLH